MACQAGISYARKRDDCEKAMRKFVSYYNAGNANGVASLFSDSWGESKNSIWQAGMRSNPEDYGKILSYKYVTVDSISDDNRITLFKVVAVKRSFMLGFDLDDKMKFGNFRFHTSSKHIDSLFSVLP